LKREKAASSRFPIHTPSPVPCVNENKGEHEGSMVRIEEQSERATNPSHRAMLEQALKALGDGNENRL